MKKTLVLALAALMVLGVAGAAIAGTSDPIPGAGDPLEASGTVTVTAKVNPKLTLTIETPDGTGTDLLLAWEITPETDEPVAKDVTLTVSSNKDYDISRTPDLGDPLVSTSLAAAGISYDFASSTLPASGTKGKDAEYTDSVNLTAPDWWEIDPGDYTGSLLYTVTQQTP